MESQPQNGESELLLQMENVKYRQTGPGKSPIGCLWIFADRVEWTYEGIQDKLVIPFAQIKVQRISPPNKPRVQLQICMNNDDQATFVFMKPAAAQEELIKDRDLVREALQQALIHHRQIMNQNSSKAEENGNREFQIKKKTLEDNAHLQSLYLHLVKEKLISPQDFWAFHYRPDEHSAMDKGGISGGFLSSIFSSEGTNGIKLNLTTDTIQSIFRTYPAVERKHLELVPHEMNNQEFWSKFFQSHYFHRERTSEANPNDPFVECQKMDDKDMKQILEQGEHSLRRHLNLSDINEDFGIFSEMRDNQISMRGSLAKATLVKRCNYHSGRVLSTIKEGGSASNNGLNNGGTAKNVDGAKTKTATIFDVDLESQELEELDREITEAPSTVNMPSTSSQQRIQVPAEAVRYKDSLKMCAGSSILTAETKTAFFDSICTATIEESEEASWLLISDAKSIDKVRVVHTCLTELLRHFWGCFPPISPELEEKMVKMNTTLINFEKKQIKECERQFGAQYVSHCKEMLEKAKSRFEAYSVHKNRAASRNQPSPKYSMGLLKSMSGYISHGVLCTIREKPAGVAAICLLVHWPDLENALLGYAYDFLRKTGEFELLQVEDILSLSTIESCDHCLSGTAEMGIANTLIGRRFQEEKLPLYFMAKSRCFRPEVSDASRESGIYRVHEFNKVGSVLIFTVRAST
uniref:BSD domain-containing protein n=1 Tax=Ditylenchus dipsaci TaxID=166011 RepID=A0A915DNB8_9BILA